MYLHLLIKQLNNIYRIIMMCVNNCLRNIFLLANYGSYLAQYHILKNSSITTSQCELNIYIYTTYILYVYCYVLNSKFKHFLTLPTPHPPPPKKIKRLHEQKHIEIHNNTEVQPSGGSAWRKISSYGRLGNQETDEVQGG